MQISFAVEAGVISIPTEARLGDSFLTYSAGRGIHLPYEHLPDAGESPTEDAVISSGATFITAFAASAAKNKQARRSKLSLKERRATQTALRVDGASFEDERAVHPAWNEDFQRASNADQLHDAIAAFEGEVWSVLSTDAGLSGLKPLSGCTGRYLHRGIYYLDCKAERDLVKYFGSVEATAKAVDAEFRAMKYLWSIRDKTGIAVPPATIVNSFGRHIFACAVPEAITQSTRVGGPQGLAQCRAVTHPVAHATLQRLCDELHLPSIFVSHEHRTKFDEIPILGSLELVTHYGHDKRVYIFECARVIPPTDPKVLNALLSYGQRPDSRQVTTPSTRTSSSRSLIPIAPPRDEAVGIMSLLRTSSNRFSNATRRALCYKLLRPSALGALAREKATIVGPDGKLIATTFANSIDGISGVAFTAVSDQRSDEFAARATAAVVDSACMEMARRFANGSITTPADVTRMLKELHLNIRYLGDVFRKIQSLIDTGVNPLDSQRFVTTPPEEARSVTVNLSSSLTMNTSGAQTARGPPRVARAIPTMPKSARGVAAPDLARRTSDAVVKPAAMPSDVSERLVAGLTIIRAEAICRCFKTLCREQWVLCAESEGQPHRKDIMDQLVEESVIAAAERSFVRAKSKINRASVSDRLLYQIKALGEDFELGNDLDEEIRFKKATAIERNRMWLVEAAPQRATYCRDTAELLKPDLQSNRTQAGRVRAKTAHMLTLLTLPSPASTKFWDTILSTEVWTKFNGLGRANDLKNVPAALLLPRACELLGVTLEDDPFTRAARYGEFRAEHIVSIAPVTKSFLPDDRPPAALRLRTPWSPLQATSLEKLEAQVKLLTTQHSESEELLTYLREMEQRLVAWGGSRKSDLALCRLSIQQAQRVLWERRVEAAWARNSLDGMVYVPCIRCNDLIDMSRRVDHKCNTWADEDDRPRAAVVRLPRCVGLSDGSVRDWAISASSSKPDCLAQYGRLDINTVRGWEPADDDSRPWWGVTFQRRLDITSMKLQGSTSTAFTRAFQLEFTTDGDNWQLFRGPYSHQSTAFALEPQHFTAGQRLASQTSFLPLISGDTIVRLPGCGLFGNTDGTSTVTIVFAEVFSALGVRIRPGADQRADPTGLRAEFYTANGLVSHPANHSADTEVVPLRAVDLDAPYQGSNRRIMTETELDLLGKINDIETDIYGGDDPMTGRAIAAKHSNDLTQLYLTLIEHYETWGPERAGDVSAMSCRLANYRVCEASLYAAQGAAAPQKVVVEITPLLFAMTPKSTALEPLLRRLTALYPKPETTPNLIALFKRVARWAGRANFIQPFLLSHLKQWCDAKGFLALARHIADPEIAATSDPGADRLPANTMPLLDDSLEHRRALLIVAHRGLVRVIEAADRIAL